MKKLKLSLQSIEGAGILSREQLKKVIGGDEGSVITVYCKVLCNNGHDYQINGPVTSCQQAYENAKNLCSGDDGAMNTDCNCDSTQ